MTDLTFDEERLEAAAARLKPKARLAFALACTERLQPNYAAFCRQTGWGKPAVLRRVLDIAWACLAGQASPDTDELAGLEEDVVACEPETEDFETILVSAALDAACCTGYVLALVRTAEPADMASVASLAVDTVDMHLRESESMPPQARALEERIRLHPLMQAELQHQDQLLTELTHADLGHAFLEDFMERSRLVAASNIGLT